MRYQEYENVAGEKVFKLMWTDHDLLHVEFSEQDRFMLDNLGDSIEEKLMRLQILAQRIEEANA